MSVPGHHAAGGDFGPAYWEGRYRGGEGAGRHAPSPWLVTETAGLAPGRALDAGCGRGAEALWLAGRGWDVTAVDVSATAVALARETALDAGPQAAARIEWVCADLTRWDPEQPAFDLVTSHYVHVPGPAEDFVRRLASWVAPGGTLLVVGHDGDAKGHAHLPGSELRLRQVAGVLPEETWEVVVAESRTHDVRRPGGAAPVTFHDVVFRARRAGRAGATVPAGVTTGG